MDCCCRRSVKPAWAAESRMASVGSWRAPAPPRPCTSPRPAARRASPSSSSVRYPFPDQVYDERALFFGAERALGEQALGDQAARDLENRKGGLARIDGPDKPLVERRLNRPFELPDLFEIELLDVARQARRVRDDVAELGVVDPVEIALLFEELQLGDHERADLLFERRRRVDGGGGQG